MPLTPYRVDLFFPGGNQAAGASVQVIIDGSNVVPLLFTDAAGTTPAPNPATADGSGVVSFYAAPGLYMAVIAGTRFRIDVDPAHPNPVHPDQYVHTQVAASAVWTINHFFGTDPEVELVVGGVVVEAQVAHPTSTQTVVTFSQAVTGTAYLRR